MTFICLTWGEGRHLNGIMLLQLLGRNKLFIHNYICPLELHQSLTCVSPPLLKYQGIYTLWKVKPFINMQFLLCLFLSLNLYFNSGFLYLVYFYKLYSIFLYSIHSVTNWLALYSFIYYLYIIIFILKLLDFQWLVHGNEELFNLVCPNWVIDRNVNGNHGCTFFYNN